MKNKLSEFELFLTRKYNGGEMNAKEYAKINLLIGEFEKQILEKNEK